MRTFARFAQIQAHGSAIERRHPRLPSSFAR
ncbi:hypothetical protein ACEWPL_017425 [Roseovarius sp. S1116L3]